MILLTTTKKKSKKNDQDFKVKLMIVGIIVVIIVIVISFMSFISHKLDSTGTSDVKSEELQEYSTTSSPNDGDSQESYGSQSNSTSLTQNALADPGTPENIRDVFLNAIRNNDMRKIYELIDLEDKTFLSIDDVEYVLRRSTISHIIGNDSPYNYVNGSVNGGKAVYYIDAFNDYDVNNDFAIKLTLNAENEWCVDYEMFAKDEFVCYCPVGVRLFLNEIEVPRKLITKRDDNYEYYTLHGITYRDWNTKIVSSSFGEIDGVIEVFDDSDAYYNKVEDSYVEIPKEIGLDLFDEVSNSVKDIYGSIYQMMDNNAPAEDLNQFICSEKDYTYFEQWYQIAVESKFDYYNNLNGNTDMLITNIMILEVYQNPNVISYVYNDNTVVVNLVLHIRWNNKDTIRSNKIVTAAKMVKEDGKWLLSDIKPNAWVDFQSNDSNASNVGNW